MNRDQALANWIMGSDEDGMYYELVDSSTGATITIHAERWEKNMKPDAVQRIATCACKFLNGEKP